MIDFGYRATHEMTLKSKQIVKAFYDQSAKYSYFKGCSTGGRMALMEAQRYPDDYDGIIAGSLANRHIHMWTAGIARSIDLSRHPEAGITAEQATLVNNLVMGKCDTLKEGFLNNPRQCKVDFASLKCKAGQADNSCLTEPQLKTVETFYGGVKNSKGELIFSGQALGNPIGAQRGARTQGPGGTFDLVRIAYNDPNVDWQKFDLDRDMKFLDEKIGYVDAVNPDLSKFKSSGGKLLLTHGWSDTGITPETTIWYYDSRSQQDGEEPERLDAPVHGARHGPLWRRPWRQHVRLDRHPREVGGEGPCAGHDDGNRCAGSDPSAVPVSAVRGIQGQRRSQGRQQLGV